MQDDRWLHYFPRGSLSARPDLHRWQAEYFAEFLHPMDELPLYPAEPHQPLVIRLLCLPTWSSACCVRIEASKLSWRIVGKEVDGEAGFEFGRLMNSNKRVLTTTEATQLADSWQSLQFWSLCAEGDYEVLDGTTYVLEAAHHGRYHVARRHRCDQVDNVGNFCELLLKQAAF